MLILDLSILVLVQQWLMLILQEVIPSFNLIPMEQHSGASAGSSTSDLSITNAGVGYSSPWVDFTYTGAPLDNSHWYR